MEIIYILRENLVNGLNLYGMQVKLIRIEAAKLEKVNKTNIRMYLSSILVLFTLINNLIIIVFYYLIKLVLLKNFDFAFTYS